MLKDKVAIVTGAAKGLGLGIATTLGKNGTKVCIADLDADALAEVLAVLKSENVEVVSVVADVSRVPAV
jgi:NAD(P)-dependent dehydrogenase (short-subunit alcohol dehydrogenase family)